MGLIGSIRPISPIHKRASKERNSERVERPDAVQARKKAREKWIPCSLVDLLPEVINIARMVWPGSFDIVVIDQALLGDGRKKVGRGDHRAKGERATDNQEPAPLFNLDRPHDKARPEDEQELISRRRVRPQKRAEAGGQSRETQ